MSIVWSREVAHISEVSNTLAVYRKTNRYIWFVYSMKVVHFLECVLWEVSLYRSYSKTVKNTDVAEPVIITKLSILIHRDYMLND